MSNHDDDPKDPQPQDSHLKDESSDPRGQEGADEAGEPMTEIPSHDQEVARLRTDNQKLEETLLRAKADLQNFRKRQLKDLNDVRRRTLEGLATELLPVLDNFRYAMVACEGDEPADTATVVEGLKMVQSMLSGVLERHGVSQVTAKGEAFDPNRHEAVGVEPAEGVDDGTVLNVLQEGYVHDERVLRPAKVIVAGAAKADDKPADDGKES